MKLICSFITNGNIPFKLFYMKRIFFLLIFFLLPFSIVFSQQPYPKPRHYPSADTMLERLNSFPNNSLGGGIYPWAFSTKVNVNDTIRRKLLQMIKPFVWPDSLVKIKARISFKKNFDYENLDYIIGEVFERSQKLYIDRFNYYDNLRRVDTSRSLKNDYRFLYDSVYNSVYDSMANEYIKSEEQNIRSSIVKTPDVLLLSAARIKLIEAIPLLKQDLVRIEPYYNRETVEITLAALGDTTYLKKMYAKHTRYVAQKEWKENDVITDINTMQLINTQESIAQIADWIDTTRKPRRDCVAGCPFVYPSAKWLSALFFQDSAFKAGFLKQPMLSGIPGTPDDLYYDPSLITKEQIQYVKEWMLANKGKYELD